MTAPTILPVLPPLVITEVVEPVDLVDELRAANKQLVTCPTCTLPLPGLLALCPIPRCRTAVLNEDMRYVRADDI